MTKPITENKMGVMPEGKLLINMALPLIASMLVQALYNIVDSLYVARISESAVTALSLAFPIQNLQIGFATGIGVGVNALFSRALGEKNRDRGSHVAGNGMFLCFVMTAVFMLFGFFGARPFFEMQSDVAETVNGGSSYVSICCIWIAGIMFEVLFERMLQSSGRTIYTLFTQGTGAVLNIILDPVFIFGVPALGIPAMGIAGAAVATVIGQWVAAILAVFFNIKCNPDVTLKLSYIFPKWHIIKDILAIGIPSAIMMVVGAVMNFGINAILQGFSETATAVFGIYYKLQSFFFMPIFGLNNASISIIAYNYGYRKPKRITRTLKLVCAVAFAVMMAGFAAFQLIPDLLLGLFDPNEEFLRVGTVALRAISCSFPIAAFCIALSSSFQALGNGMYSTIVSVCRQLVVLLPVAFLLSLTGEVTNVWWSFPIAELASLAATVVLFIRIYRKKIRPLYHEEA
ncbi:MAG: MATE family efflux transporter [Clostridia bacterium]|nr:MATE family efflux transporter [Clostridia bacterium]